MITVFVVFVAMSGAYSQSLVSLWGVYLEPGVALAAHRRPLVTNDVSTVTQRA